MQSIYKLVHVYSVSLFLLKVINLSLFLVNLFLINYSIKLVEERNRVVPCTLQQSIKQFFKFEQSSHTHNLTIIVIAITI